MLIMYTIKSQLAGRGVGEGCGGGGEGGRGVGGGEGVQRLVKRIKYSTW